MFQATSVTCRLFYRTVWSKNRACFLEIKMKIWMNCLYIHLWFLTITPIHALAFLFSYWYLSIDWLIDFPLNLSICLSHIGLSESKTHKNPVDDNCLMTIFILQPTHPISTRDWPSAGIEVDRARDLRMFGWDCQICSCWFSLEKNKEWIRMDVSTKYRRLN